MGKFLKTTKNEKHWHAAYITDDGQGATSKDNDHTHAIIFFPDVPEQPPVTDQQGNVVRPGIPAQKGGFRVMPAGVNDHTHELEDIEVIKKTDDGDDDEESVKMIKALFKQAKSIEKESRDSGSESMDFFNNKQWDNESIEKLKKMERCFETINEINHKIKLLSGYQRQNRTDIRYIPVENGDQISADILNAISKNVCEQNNFSHIETLVFEEGAITGRGFYHIYLDYEGDIDIDKQGNIKGQIKIKKFPWDGVYLGPHEEFTLDDCEYAIKTKWYSKAKLRELYPEKADEISAEWSEIEIEADKNSGNPHVERLDYPTMAKDGETYTYSPLYYDIAQKNILVFELEKKRYVKLDMLLSIDDEQFYDKKTFEPSFLKKAITIPGFSELKRTITEFWVYQSTAGTLLDKRQSDFDYFSVIPFYVEKHGNTFYGKVETVKGEQRIVNKTASQTMDIINKVAAYGWFYDDNTFNGDRKLENQFKNQSSSAGFMQKVANVGAPPQKVEGVKFPGEIVQIQSIHSEKLRELMNVNNELLGLNSKAESGVAIVEKKRQGLVGNEYIFDNLALAKRLFGRVLVQAIQKSYTPKRIYRLLRSMNSRAPIKLGGQPLDVYTEDQIFSVLNNLDISKFDVVVSESDHSPTMKQTNLVIMADLYKNGVPFSPSLFLELSDLPEDLKNKELQFMQQQAQAQAAAEDKKYQTEIDKTRLAQQGKVITAQISKSQQGVPRQAQLPQPNQLPQ